MYNNSWWVYIKILYFRYDVCFSRLITVLAGKVGFQIQYQLVFCLWVLTFNPNLADRVSKYVYLCSTPWQLDLYIIAMNW